MAKFTALLTGTIVFLVIGLMMCLSGQLFRKLGRLSSGEAKLLNLFVLIAFICMWMMWAMTWLSQVNPILYPQVHNELYNDTHA